VEKIGRNEPCICGSGKKYKKCCLVQEQEREARQRDEAGAASRALDWLATEFPGAIRETVQAGFYGGLKKTEREVLEGLSGEVMELLNINIGEWLLTDAKISVEGAFRPVREILLGENGVPLSPGGLRWLESLGESALGLYEVLRVNPGDGLWVKNVMHENDPAIWIRDRTASRNMVAWDIFGARIVNNGEYSILSGALYPFKRDAANKTRAKLVRKLKDITSDSSESRDIYCNVIVNEWLKTLVAAQQSAEDTTEMVSLDLDAWPDAELAVLGDRTPKKAVKTDAGRRAVIDLIKGYENFVAHQARLADSTPADTALLWQALGLQPERN
jgi:hypothetical protein